jgi:hypothetical protein
MRENENPKVVKCQCEDMQIVCYCIEPPEMEALCLKGEIDGYR